jgi:hypothetical protein
MYMFSQIGAKKGEAKRGIFMGLTYLLLYIRRNNGIISSVDF